MVDAAVLHEPVLATGDPADDLGDTILRRVAGASWNDVAPSHRRIERAIAPLVRADLQQFLAVADHGRPIEPAVPLVVTRGERSPSMTPTEAALTLQLTGDAPRWVEGAARLVQIEQPTALAGIVADVLRAVTASREASVR